MSGWLSPQQTRILAENTQRLRLEREWTQEQLAANSGVHVTTIRQLQAGRASVQEGTLTKLATAFGFEDVDDMLLPYNPPEPPPPQEPDYGPAHKAFSRELEELKKAALDLRSDIIWFQLAARIRTLTSAVRTEKRRMDGD